MASSTPIRPSLVIGGPTASGKTSLALAIAKKVGGIIINADAFQIYRGLPLLTAQPTQAELGEVPHHLFGALDTREDLDAARYRTLAVERIVQCHSEGRPALLVGGTGLYIKAVLYGLSTGLPEPDPALRATLECQPLEALSAQLVSLDPVAAGTVDLRNPRRVIRALEVCLLTGKPFTSFKDHKPWQGACAGVWLSLPRAALHERIAQRAGRLFPEGVEAEVRSALPSLGQTARQAIGVQPVAEVIAGKISREEAQQRICAATRQYARRQETWFRKEAALQPVTPAEALETSLRLLFQP